MPLVDEIAFLTSATISTGSQDLLALRCAVCTHGIATSPNFNSWAAANIDFVSNSDYSLWFYQLAKNHLELAENETRYSLAILQATALVALYNLERWPI